MGPSAHQYIASRLQQSGDFYWTLWATRTGLGVGSLDGYIRSDADQALAKISPIAWFDRILLGGSTSGLDSLKWMEPRALADCDPVSASQIQAIVRCLTSGP